MIERVSSAGAGRLVRVSLRDVPLQKRRYHARYLIASCQRDGDLMTAIELERAVLFPSDRSYLIPVEMVEQVLGVVPNGQPRKRVHVDLPEQRWSLYDGVG